MSRQSFKELLNKYLRGNSTPEEQRFIEHWYGLLDDPQALESLDEDELEERMWQEIQLGISDAPDVKPKVTAWLWKGAAALVALLGLYFVSISLFSTNKVAHEVQWLEQKNTTSAEITIHLEDGSKVILFANSSLKFPKRFASDKREVQLKGNAYFDIEEDPEKPFFVHSRNVVTKVLGTSFYIREDEHNKEVKVEVKSGKVEVYSGEKTTELQAEPLVLTRNLAATYHETEKQFELGLVENPTVEITQNQSSKEKSPIDFRFNDSPLKEVIAKLQEGYGIDFKIENETQYKCLITANLNNQPLHVQLDIICAALGFKHKLQGATILLQGSGCE